MTLAASSLAGPPPMFKHDDNRFELLEPLGMGTVGTVYRARDRQTGEVVALKLLMPVVSHDPKILGRFEREMTIMERLSHRHIVRYGIGGRLGGQLFYTMELLDGGNLKQLLQAQHRLPWQQVVAWAIQICSALQHAHNHGVIHRDLKPANLFISHDGRMVLGDFGIARDTTGVDLTAAGITVGTFTYMSPEQITADQRISGKADLYSLGCLLYELLTGQPPFQGQNFAQVWDQHLNKTPLPIREQVPNCPPWLEKIVLQLLQKDPEKRPFNARFVEGYLKQHGRDAVEQGEAPAEPLPSPLATAHGAAVATSPADSVSWTMLAVLFAAVAGVVCLERLLGS